MAKLDPRNCEVCGAQYQPLQSNQKYCSGTCYVRASIERRREKRGLEPKPKPQKKPYVMKNPTKVSCCVCGEEHVIDNPHKEVGLFYCTDCLKEYGGKTPNSKIEGRERIRISVPKLGVD